MVVDVFCDVVAHACNVILITRAGKQGESVDEECEKAGTETRVPEAKCPRFE